jgi:hypothetical protein
MNCSNDRGNSIRMNHNGSDYYYYYLKVIRVYMNEILDIVSLNPFLYKLRRWCHVIPRWAIRENVNKFMITSDRRIRVS